MTSTGRNESERPVPLFQPLGSSPRPGPQAIGFATPLNCVIPNPPAEGGQERDLTSLAPPRWFGDASPSGTRHIAISITVEMMHQHRKVPLSPVSSVRLRDDIVGIIRVRESIEDIMPVPTAFQECTFQLCYSLNPSEK